MNKKGFTLIELMVVIAIIAILATVGMVIYGGVQKNGRISKRIQDLKAIRLAVEAYKVDNGNYPNTLVTGSPKWSTMCNYGGGTIVVSNANSMVPNLYPKYMQAIPQDPSMNTTAPNSCYIYVSDGNNYKIMDYNVAEMTNSDYQKQPELIDPNHDGQGTSGQCPSSDSSNGQITGWAIWSDASFMCQ